jgi:UPF0271 protein
MQQSTIDLNADLGESPARLADGSDSELMRFITSANVACGGHAGDGASMEVTLRLAKQNQVAVGAHPSYPDPANFCRVELKIAIAELEQSIREQLERLTSVARQLGVSIGHAKPHGALYHSCNREPDVARAVCRAVLALDSGLMLIAQAGSPAHHIYRQMGLATAAEAFVDRAYEDDGTLRARTRPGALIDSPEAAAAQAISIVKNGKVVGPSGAEIPISADTLCIHSDTPGSAAIARAVKEALTAAGVSIQPLRTRPKT